MPTPLDAVQLVILHAKTVDALGVRLSQAIEPVEGRARELKQQLSHFAHLIGTDQFTEAQWELRRLEAFIFDWDIVASKAPGLLDEFRIRTLSDEQRGGYLGVRTELQCAAFVCQGSFSPRRGDPSKNEADFILDTPQGTVSIECTSSHLSTPKEANFSKIAYAITEKAKKAYCGSGAVLYFDYTSILWHLGDVQRKGFPGRVQEVVDLTSWGAVVLVATFMSQERHALERGYLRFDGHQPETALKVWLDQCLPPDGVRHAGRLAIPPTA